MPTKENQHYVPKFYLRKFSIHENNKQIGLFNKEKEFYFPAASIKHQASKPYFYGKNLEIENTLGILEGIYSKILNDISLNQELPKRTHFDNYLLIQFIILTCIRNPIQSETTKKSFEKFVDLLQSRGPREEKFDEMLSTIDELKFHALSQISLLTEICLDLEFKMLRNNTNVPFITSDNPVVKYNQFLEKRKFHGCATGYSSLGLQFIFPINPDLAIIGYDKTIYKVGFRKQNLISTNLKQDIDNINILQFVNCYENVFFNHLVDRRYLSGLFNASKKFPRANVGKAEEYPEIDDTGKILKNQTISVMYTTDCKTNLNLSFIKETRQAKVLKLENRAVHLRKHAEVIRKKYST